MINIDNISESIPFLKFSKAYKKALKEGQNSIQAACISSYHDRLKVVDSRFVNIKNITHEKLIFFTNYQSPKAEQFNTHDQVSVLFFWDSINTQIRIKSHIKKTSIEYNNNYFQQRSNEKNALAISSDQSKIISSYDEVVSKYNHIKNNANLKKCPNFWGGYSLTPYQIEFWQGHQSRINKREVFDKIDESWKLSTLQP